MTSPTAWYLGPSRAAGTAAAVPEPKDDPFYKYDGPLEMDPGTVLRTRRTTYHVLGVQTALKATQLLYRSTNQGGNPTANVTSIISPLVKPNKTKVLCTSPPTTRSTRAMSRRCDLRRGPYTHQNRR